MRRLAQLREFHPEFRKAGCEILLVLCQKRTAVGDHFEKQPMPFRVVVDDDRAVAKRWGVYVALSYDSIHIARPASFVVDATGIVRYAHVSRHQMDHPDLENILAVVRSL